MLFVEYSGQKLFLGILGKPNKKKKIEYWLVRLQIHLFIFVVNEFFFHPESGELVWKMMFSFSFVFFFYLLG